MNRIIRSAAIAAAVAGCLGLSAPASFAAGGKSREASSHERGRYLVTIAGCNDCHTPGFAMSGGKVDEKNWLTGDSLGWRGEWVDKARHLTTRPPMPYFALNAMTDRDLRALYRYIHDLGPAGAPAPAYLPPNQEPKPPYVTFPAPPK